MDRREIREEVKALLREQDECEGRERRLYDSSLEAWDLGCRLWGTDTDYWYGNATRGSVSEEWYERLGRLDAGVVHYATWRLGVFFSDEVVDNALHGWRGGEGRLVWLATAPVAAVVEWALREIVHPRVRQYTDEDTRQTLENGVRSLLRERDALECRPRPLYSEEANLYELAYRLFSEGAEEFFDFVYGEARGKVTEGWLEWRGALWKKLVEAGEERVGKFYSKRVVDFVLGVPDRVRGAVHACFAPLCKVARRVESNVFPLLVSLVDDVEYEK